MTIEDKIKNAYFEWIFNLVCTNNDTKFTTGLNGISLGDARIAHGNVFQVIEALDVGFHDFAAGTGPSATDCVTYLNDWSNE